MITINFRVSVLKAYFKFGDLATTVAVKACSTKEAWEGGDERGGGSRRVGVEMMWRWVEY